MVRHKLPFIGIHMFSAPTGRGHTAQGEALGSSEIFRQALKGRNPSVAPSPFQGLWMIDHFSQGFTLGYFPLPRWRLLKKSECKGCKAHVALVLSRTLSGLRGGRSQ